MIDTEYFLKISGTSAANLHYESEMVSTSDRAKSLAQDGAESGTLVLTDFQTGGRGRGGNVWQCEAEKGLLFSLLLEPDIDPSLWYRFSLAVGVAVAMAIGNQGAEVGMKWPNDLQINGKKMAGILIEVVNGRLIVGVGINVNGLTFPEEIKDKATSLLNEGVELRREDLLVDIVRNIYQWGSLCGEAFPRVIEEVRTRCVLSGKRVSMTSQGKSLSGVVEAISDEGFILLRVNGELIEVVEAKDIRWAQDTFGLEAGSGKREASKSP